MNRIFPPVNTMGRALFLWNKSEVDSSAERTALVNFCSANAITTVLLHFYQWIGAANWNCSNVGNLQTLITALNNAAVQVYGLIGGVDYPFNQPWVRRNILGALQAFNAASAHHPFQGLVFDNEYWTESYNLSNYIPAYYRLMDAARGALDLPVGAFVQRDLLDPERDAIDCRGLNDVDGAHLLAMSDFVFVGSYDSQAAPHESYPGQIAMLNPWVTAAESLGSGTMVWGCSETKDVTPSWITYYGSSKVAMEVQHASIASAFAADAGSPYVGQAVHDYTAYKNMG